MNIERKTWELRFHDGSPPVRGDVRSPSGRLPTSAVIICHGFKGFRNWGFFPDLARTLARRGFTVLTFDFSRNGVGDDGVDFSALERFAEGTHSRNLDEIGFVLDALYDGSLTGAAPRRVALLGHSRGGGEALLHAARDPRVDALVTWSAISSIRERWSREFVQAWERGETVYIRNARTGQEMPMAPVFWQDIMRNSDRLDIRAHASKLRVPWLIVHGDSDETVAVSEARTLVEAAGPNADFHIVEGGTHTFGATHPFAGTTPQLTEATRATLRFLAEHLR